MVRRQSGCPDTVTRVQAQPVKTGDNALVLRMIAFYQRWISPLLPPRCRFVPSCSAYASEAIRSYGTARGALMSVKRVCRCHPFHPGGYDPVPLAEQTNDLSTVHEVCEHDEQTSTNRH